MDSIGCVGVLGVRIPILSSWIWVCARPMMGSWVLWTEEIVITLVILMLLLLHLHLRLLTETRGDSLIERHLVPVGPFVPMSLIAMIEEVEVIMERIERSLLDYLLSKCMLHIIIRIRPGLVRMSL